MKAEIFPSINHCLKKELLCQTERITFGLEKSKHLK